MYFIRVTCHQMRLLFTMFNKMLLTTFSMLLLNSNPSIMETGKAWNTIQGIWELSNYFRKAIFRFSQCLSRLGRDISVYTGTHGILQYPDFNGVNQNIHLYNSTYIPAPLYFWKILQDLVSLFISSLFLCRGAGGYKMPPLQL